MTAALDEQFGSDQKSHAQHDETQPRGLSALRAAPPDQECEAAPEPEEHESGLEPGCGQRPNGGNCDEHHCAERQEEAAWRDPTHELARRHEGE